MAPDPFEPDRLCDQVRREGRGSARCHSPTHGQGPSRASFRGSRDGIGIPEPRRERVFEVFAQADGSITRRCGGTGLGLAICERLVRVMGGRIWVESGRPHGSVFCFTLNLTLDASAPTEAAAERRRAFVLGADHVHQRSVVERLRAWGLIVSSAQQPQECGSWWGRIANEQPVDLILADEPAATSDPVELRSEVLDEQRMTPGRLVALTAADSACSRRWRESGRCA
ncbi:MAG: hypothetical protein JSV80_07995 [Acidobacteriota bacterium]|nr:MAG: hypothetical protein JSV80_07995 [Acidobacteriota bacterium]